MLHTIACTLLGILVILLVLAIFQLLAYAVGSYAAKLIGSYAVDDTSDRLGLGVMILVGATFIGWLLIWLGKIVGCGILGVS